MSESRNNIGVQPLPVDKKKVIWLMIALLTLLTVLFIPLSGLTISGQRALAIAAFSIVVWVSECISYSLSAFAICTLITYLIGYAPDPTAPEKILGLSGAFKLAFAGWLEEMVWFMMGGLIIALSMNITGLDRRIALWIVSRFHTAKGALIGVIIATNVLAFFMPPVVARMAALVPIIVGIIVVFGQPLNSRFAASLGVCVAIMGNTSAFGLMSGGSMNPLVASFVEQATGVNISWLQWFIWFYPYTIVMSVVLYFILTWWFKPEIDSVPGGKPAIQKMYQDLGPWTSAQRRLLILTAVTVCFWATSGIVFKLNLTAITLVAVTCFMMPGIGVVDWETVEKRLPWGTLLLFATGIAQGMLLLKTEAAVWLASAIFDTIGLGTMGVLMATLVFVVIAVMLHFGFSSATALCATYIPVVIAYIQSNGRADLSLIGIPLIILIATGLTILVVNTPNTMIAFGSGTFYTRDFFVVGLINTAIAIIAILVFSVTYWRWLGLM
ncbi:MAG: SLC13 family permease [Sporomusa sp.]